MTLEDFFTLTEMQDGLTAPARVEELVSVMKTERDSLVKNVGDATRQLASVASTIAATENKECLDLFVQLDGLCFLDGWLKDVQTSTEDGSDSFAEEAISALLQAVEKLQIDNERLISSGICITVKNLLSYSSTRVQDRARTLFDSWKARNVDLRSMDVEKSAFCGNPTLNNEHSNTQVPANSVSSSRSLDDENQCNSLKPLDHTTSSEGGCHDTVASPVKMVSVEVDISTREVIPSDGESDQPFSSDPKQSKDEASSKVLKSERVVGNASQCDNIGSACDRLGKVEVSSANESADVPSSNGSTAKETNTKSHHDKNDANDDLAVRISSDDTNRLIYESRNEVDCTGSLELKRLEVTGSHCEAKKRGKSNRKYFGNSCGFARLTRSSKSNDIIKQTNMDLEDGTVDALEVTCFLAKEVEREVMVYNEQSGSLSSDETMSRCSNGQPESPRSIIGEDPEINAPSNDLASMNIVSHEPPKIQHMFDPTNQDTELENRALDMESSSQVTDSLCEPEVNTERSVWGFDLNQEFSSADRDDQFDISNPVSIVSATTTVAVPGRPADLTQFGGSLGRVSDGEKAHFDGGTSSSSWQRQGFLNIDLNVAESEDDKIINPMLGKQNTMLPALLSGESSVGLSPMKFDLNLNLTDEDEMNENILGFQNTRRSPSPASSSSCLQPPMRNFDLNDNPSHSCNLSNQYPFLNELSSRKTSSYMGPSDDSVFSLLGVKVKMNAVLPQTPPFLNKMVPEPLMGTHLRGGTILGLGHTVPYGQSVYGYNGLAMGPPLVSFPPGLTYGPGGPVPYMFDSRGAPVMPQILGSGSTVPPSYDQPSFVMNMMGSSAPVSNVPVYLDLNLDLNSGFATEAGNRDPGFFKQFLGPGHGRRSEEPLRGNVGKRKEPDTGWDLLAAANYKHPQPPHL